MAVSLFFGLPGCGKTTILTMLAFQALKSKKYKHVYTNVELLIPGVTYIDNDAIGKYELEHALILIDEATLYADNRDYASFSKSKITYFLEHRHFNVDIYLFTQQWDGVDRKIRVITDRVYYVYKSVLFGWFLSEYYRIPYGVIIPDPKDGNQKLGEIIQGYCKPNLLIRLFSHKCFRPAYYKYFDSWTRPKGFSPLPSYYQPHGEFVDSDYVNDLNEYLYLMKRKKWNKTVILLRSIPRKISGTICRSWRSLKSSIVKFFASRHAR